MKNVTALLLSALFLLSLSSCEKHCVGPDKQQEPDRQDRQHYSQACQQYFYYYGGQATNLGPALTDEIIIGFKKGTSPDKKLKVLAAYPHLGNILYTEETAGGEVTVVSLQPNVSCSVVDSLWAVLPLDNHIDFAGPFFQYPNYPGAKLGVTNSVVLSLASGTSQKQLNDLLAEVKAEIVIDYGFGGYVIKLTRQSPMNVLQTANYLFETGLFEASEPDFLTILPPL